MFEFMQYHRVFHNHWCLTVLFVQALSLRINISNAWILYPLSIQLNKQHVYVVMHLGYISIWLGWG